MDDTPTPDEPTEQVPPDPDALAWTATDARAMLAAFAAASDQDAAPVVVSSPHLRLVFAAPVGDRAIHAIRTGTFTDSYGTETTFTADDMLGMAERLNAGAERRRPPINEGHDYGRAVGRMLRAYARHKNNHLYIEPRWNGEGRRLLSDEVYDSFSIEIKPAPKNDGLPGAWQIIGGALTNYPAVDGLSPLSLSAPTGGAVPTLVLPDEPDPVEELSMTEPTPAPMPELELPAPPLLSDPALQQQFAAYNQQMQTHFRQQFEQMQTQAQAEAQRQFQQWQAEQRRESSILAFAQHVTAATLDRQHALPFTAEQVADALRGLNDAQRGKVEALLSGVLDSGLVAFDRLGAAGEGAAVASAKDEYAALVYAKVEKGMSRFDALRAVNKDRPDLYQAQKGDK